MSKLIGHTCPATMATTSARSKRARCASKWPARCVGLHVTTLVRVLSSDMSLCQTLLSSFLGRHGSATAFIVSRYGLRPVSRPHSVTSRWGTLPLRLVAQARGHWQLQSLEVATYGRCVEEWARACGGAVLCA